MSDSGALTPKAQALKNLQHQVFLNSFGSLILRLLALGVLTLCCYLLSYTFIPLLVPLWMADAYFMQKKNTFNALKDKVQAMSDKASSYPQQPGKGEFTGQEYSWWGCLMSYAQMGFYGVVLIMAFGLIYIDLANNA